MNLLPTRNRLHAGAYALIVVLGTLPLPGAPAGADTPETAPLSTLEDYLDRALAENPALEAVRQRYEAARRRVPQAAALPDPILQVTHFVESVQTRTGPQENAFMIGQKIPWLGKLDSREAAASAEAGAMWQALRDEQLLLARRVAVAFYEYGYTDHAIRLSGENLDLLRNLEPVVEEKIRSGGDLNALLRLKVEMGKIDDRLQSLRRKRVAQSAELAALLDLPGAPLLPWPDWNAPEPLPFDGRSLGRALEANNPALGLLEEKIAAAEARRESARLDSYPDLTLGLNYIEVGDPVVNPATPDAGRDPWGFTVTVNLPLWLGKNEAARAEALAAQRAAESEHRNRLNTLRAEFASALATLEDANRRLRLYGEELLGLAEQAVENSRSSYEGGRTGILEVIDSERSLLDLQLLYWRAAADARQQHVTIRTLAGSPATGETAPVQ